MADTQTTTISDKDIRKVIITKGYDLSTIFGFILAFGLIITALLIGGVPGAFIDIKAFLIVFGGTLAVTIISYTSDELKAALKSFSHLFFHNNIEPDQLANQLIDISVISKKKGILAIQQAEKKVANNKFLARGLQMVSDGVTGEDILKILGHEINSQIARHQSGAKVMRRAADAAPAMGLIGTLVGLVQMLSMLDDPSTVGPSMAVALLTTFYGAILGTVIFSPLANKLELKAKYEYLQKHLILTAIKSIAMQENPRRLEMMLNSELPPVKRIRYFK